MAVQWHGFQTFGNEMEHHCPQEADLWLCRLGGAMLVVLKDLSNSIQIGHCSHNPNNTVFLLDNLLLRNSFLCFMKRWIRKAIFNMAYVGLEIQRQPLHFPA